VGEGEASAHEVSLWRLTLLLKDQQQKNPSHTLSTDEQMLDS
jgi:hypothetical protein